MEIYILMEDVDQTLFSRPEPLDYAVPSKEEAEAFVRDDQRQGRTFWKVRLFDTAQEVAEFRRRKLRESEVRIKEMLQDELPSKPPMPAIVAGARVKFRGRDVE